jgi:acetyltransferase-like isoleucine patch superfamily enzyme
MNAHLEKLLRALGPGRQEPLSAIARKALSNAHAIGCAMTYLRRCDAIGARARSFGRPHIENHGSLVIGDDFAASCTFGTVLLATGPKGHILIGDGVTVNYGSSITATSQVWLGNRVMVGPYCVIADTDAPLVDDGVPMPIEIGDDVWLAGRVMVRPGSRIGAGAVIGAGSVVEGEIPAGAIASGAPARVLRIRRPSELPPPHADADVTSISGVRARVPEARVHDAGL